MDYEIDVDEINERWADEDNVDVWSQAVIKQTEDQVGLITEAPPSGIWHIGPRGKLEFMHAATDWHDLHDDTEAFHLRIAGPGDYRYKGADLGILITRGRLQSDDAKSLTPLCKRWIKGIKAQFASTPVDTGTSVPHAPATPSTKSM